MATVGQWTPFGVAFDISASANSVTRVSATQFRVSISASWVVHWSGASTNYGMTASSGGGSANLNSFGNYASSGSGSFTGTYSISGNEGQTKSINVTFTNSGADGSKSQNVSFDVWVPAVDSWTVSYNANGGSGAPGEQTKWRDQALTLSSAKPTRTGYTFVKWNTKADGTGTSYNSGTSYTANSGATLYAIWQINKYYLDVNGLLDGTAVGDTSGYGTFDVYINGSLVSDNVSDFYQQYNYGTTYSISGVSASTGRTYNGVSSGSASGTINGTKQVQLKFTSNTYSITYNANGGTGAPSAQSYVYSPSGTINLSSTIPTRAGYTFLGWSTSNTATSASYSPGQAWNKNNASNYTLYAVWTENYLTVNYYSNYADYCTYEGSPKSVSATTNVKVLTVKYYYDNAYDYGLNDIQNADALYLSRTRYDSTGYWGTVEEVDIGDSTGEIINASNGVAVRQDRSFASGQALAEVFGKSLVNGNAEVNVYAQWVLLCSRITVYTADGNGHRGLCHFYDDNGNRHYAIITVYDQNGNARVVV